MGKSFSQRQSSSVKAIAYLKLTRLNRPIGIYLVLWPTLWALWLAAAGAPSVKNLIIFVLGCVVMRSAGCVINDYADRKIDGRVKRTVDRPLITGEVSSTEALVLFVTLCLVAFLLVLFTTPFTIALSLGGVALAVLYPFTKRYTQLPQVILGCAFAWSVPMAFAAQAGELGRGIWLIYVAVVLWTVSYDTFYAMVDRDDDIKIGVKSTAILFGEMDRAMTASLQALTVFTLITVGNFYKLSWIFYSSIAVVAALFAYQQWLIRDRDRAACFKAFLNNNWVGMTVFIGIVAHYAVYPATS